jgi:hypothetical protein
VANLFAEFAAFAVGQLPLATLQVTIRLAPRLDRLSQPDFVLLGEKGVSADLIQIEPDEILVSTLGPFLGHPNLSIRLAMSGFSAALAWLSRPDTILNVGTSCRMPNPAMFCR